MVKGSCVNCGDPEARTYELLVRSSKHEAVALCDTCHEAIEREMREEA